MLLYRELRRENCVLTRRFGRLTGGWFVRFYGWDAPCVDKAFYPVLLHDLEKGHGQKRGKGSSSFFVLWAVAKDGNGILQAAAVATLPENNHPIIFSNLLTTSEVVNTFWASTAPIGPFFTHLLPESQFARPQFIFSPSGDRIIKRANKLKPAWLSGKACHS